MEVDERVVASLMKLGLTRYEALAYMALVCLGSGTVADINKESGVPTTKLYEVMRKLEAKGWVEVLRERPLKFKARPPDEVLESALKGLMKEVEDAKTVLAEIYEKRVEVERSEVWMVRGLVNVEKKMIDMIKGARAKIYLALSKLAMGFLDRAKETLKNAYWRGLEVRVLLTGVEEAPDLGGLEVVVLRRAPTPTAPEITIVHSLVVVDASELLLVLPMGVRGEGPRDVVGVWVRDPSLAQLAEDYVAFTMRVARETGS